MKKKSIENFAKFLKANGFKEETVKSYLNHSSPFLDELEELEWRELENQISFIIERQRIKLSGPNINSLRASLHQFFLMKTGTTIKDYRTMNKSKGDNQQLLDKLLCYLLKIRKYTRQSAHKCVKISESFIEFVTKKRNAIAWSEIDATVLRDYIQERAKTISKSSLGVEATNLRSFFKFLEFYGEFIQPSVFNLKIAAPRLSNIRIPKIFSSEELNKAIDFFSEKTERDVRNKLIVLLLVELGLRTSDVSAILLEDIHWRSGTITIRSSKTKSMKIMPFSCRLGLQMEQYVLLFRPHSEDKHLFIRIGRYRGSAMTTEQIRRNVRFMIKETGLYSYWTGPHAFRRTFGSRLYNAGIGLKEVADILGHECLNSTTAYARVDIEGLRSIAGEWPIIGDSKC